MNISIQIPPADSEAIKKVLSPEQYHKAAFGAVKRTTIHLASETKKVVKANSFIEYKYIERVIKATEPRAIRLSARSAWRRKSCR